MTPKKAFNDHKTHARERNISFLFTYSEWLEMWMLSGKWNERGKTSKCYVMARYGDIGAYSLRNCKIISVEENCNERWEGKKDITDKQAIEIKHMYKNTNYSQKEIAKIFNVSQSHVSRIINGKRRNSCR